MRHRHNHGCGCNKPIKEVIHPVKNNVVHHCTEEVVKHIHPSHTTIMNHHLVKNEHMYPHSTSVKNMYDEVNVNRPPSSPNGMGPGNEVAGTMDNGTGKNCHGPKMGKHNKHMPNWRF